MRTMIFMVILAFLDSSLWEVFQIIYVFWPAAGLLYGGAWITVIADCITADQEILNLMSVQQLQKLFEVWGQSRIHSRTQFAASIPARPAVLEASLKANMLFHQTHRAIRQPTAPNDPFRMVIVVCFP